MQSDNFYQNVRNNATDSSTLRPAPPVPHSQHTKEDVFHFFANDTNQLPAPNTFHENKPEDSDNDDDEDDDDDDDEWDDESSIPEEPNQNEQRNSLPEQSDEPDPFDTSHLHVYDEPPDDCNIKSSNLSQKQEACRVIRKASNNSVFDCSATYGTEANGNKVEDATLNEQIGSLWLKNVAHQIPNMESRDQPSYTNSTSFSVANSSVTPLNSKTYMSSLPTESASQKKRHHVTFSSSVASSYANKTLVSLTHSASFKDNLSQSTPSLVPRPENAFPEYHNNQFTPPSLKPKENNFPKLDANFIAELEKNLGKDQASANTFTSKEKQVTSPTLLPDKVSMPTRPSQQGTPSYYQDSLSASQPNLREPLELGAVVTSKALTKPSVNVNAFSDLDVLSSSRSLGLAPKENVDLAQYFQKEAHVKNLLLPNVSSSSPAVGRSLTSVSARSLQKSNVPNTVEDSWRSSLTNLSCVAPTYAGHTTPRSTPSSFLKDSANSNIPSIFFSSQQSVLQHHQTFTTRHKYATGTRASEVVQPTVVVSPQLTVNYNQVSLFLSY